MIGSLYFIEFLSRSTSQIVLYLKQNRLPDLLLGKAFFGQEI